MTKSMTGFGKAERVSQQRKIIVEIRSLNSKQMDLSVKIPAIYKEKEYEIRNLISGSLGRGKVDVFVMVENTTDSVFSGAISESAFISYFNEIKSLYSKIDSTSSILDTEILNSVLHLPGVIDNPKIEVSDTEWEDLFSAINEALEEINDFRQKEGSRLIEDILLHVDNIEGFSALIPQYESERIELIRKKFEERLSQIEVDVDKNRFEQEIIYYLEKLDITEEKIRLGQHIKYFREVADSGDDIGRKLGFIAQEMGREINTTGSKANHVEIQKLVVQMKDELEKIKEQVLNIL